MISDYKNRKAGGFVELEKSDDKVKVKMKHFNEWNGEESEIEEEISRDDIAGELAIREAQVVELKALLDDIDKL